MNRNLAFALALIVGLCVKIGIRSMLRSATSPSPRQPQVVRTPDYGQTLPSSNQESVDEFNRQSEENREEMIRQLEESQEGLGRQFDVPQRSAVRKESEEPECREDKYCWDDWDSSN